MKDAIKSIVLDSILSETYVSKHVHNDIVYKGYTPNQLYNILLKKREYVLDIKALITNMFVLDKVFCKKNPKFNCDYGNNYENTLQSYFSSLDFVLEHRYDFLFAISTEDNIQVDYDIHVMALDAFIVYNRHLREAIDNKDKFLNFQTPQRAINTFTSNMIDVIYKKFDKEGSRNIEVIYEFVGYNFIYKDFYSQFKQQTNIVESILNDKINMNSFESTLETYIDQMKNLESLLTEIKATQDEKLKSKNLISFLEKNSRS